MTATTWLMKKKKKTSKIIYECRTLDRRFYRIRLENNFQIKPSKQTRLKMTSKHLLIEKTYLDFKHIRKRGREQERQNEREIRIVHNLIACCVDWMQICQCLLHTQHTRYCACEVEIDWFEVFMQMMLWNLTLIRVTY